MGWKYIMFEVSTKSIKRKVPIIFPDALVHLYVGTVVKMALEEQFKGATVKAVSAGAINELSVNCTFSNSTTLGLKAAPGDDEVINSYPYFHGMS